MKTGETRLPQEMSIDELQALLNDKLQAEKELKQQERQSYEGIKENTITSLAGQAIAIHNSLKVFKETAFGDCETLYKLLQQYSSRHADGKGNFTVKSADGKIEMSLKRAELGGFDERADQGEKHIIDFVNKQFAGDVRTKKLIMSLLERKKDKLDVKLVQKLYSMENDYDDANWKEGIRLLKEAWQPSETKDYLSFKVNGKYVILDFARI